MKRLLLFVSFLFVLYVAHGTVPPDGYPEERKVFEAVDRSPAFPGGSDALVEWIESHLRYPALAEEQHLEGKVVAAFWVEKDGTVSTVHILRSPHELFSREVRRVLKFMPRWIPGCENGRAIRVRYTIPFTFRLLPPDQPKEKR